MSEEEHRIYFSTDFSTQNKDSGSFTTHLPYTLNLEGDWKCAILDFFISPDISKNSSQFIYILGDFCETSIILGIDRKPILKKAYLSSGTQYYEFTYPLYIPLKQSSITDFDLVFSDSSLTPIKLRRASKIECTLHFTKNG